MRKTLILGLGLLLSAQAATVTPSGAASKTILPASVSAFNLGNWMPVIEATAELNALKPAALRWPGGNIGDEQNRTPAAMETLKSMWTLLGQPPLMLQTRVFSRDAGNRSGEEAKNTPEDAAEMVRMARGLGLNVAYYEIGNEPDLYATNRSDPSWTPQKYCGVVRAQKAAILKVDPQAKIAGPAVSNPGAFLDAVIKECGDAFDLVTWHLYPSNGDGSDAQAFASIGRVTDTVERVKKLWADPATNPKGQGKMLAQGVTEYAQSYRSDRATHLSDAVGGLWAAEAALRMSESGAVFNPYFSLMATGNHGLLDDAGFPRMSYAAFRELANYRGQTFGVQSDDPAVWLHASKQDNLLTLFAINTQPDATPLILNLPGYTVIGAKTVTDADVNADRPPRALKLGRALTLPPLSFTRVVLKSSD
ncbi:hypothetical protein [Deinococcus marmoris]|uniref:Uncharacterized protein n=1 Tax=Deinococcus marmoris TaxID=249408 RepID=A0A1U7P1P1_9DEIO|nr:hypothetical protein [Deinococcus marmoris]OLV19095.1 hypothetical protein BOO71_0003988 [Deinococcus marmoris]